MPYEPTEQHAWEAFCYLSGEMSAEEQVRFESHLADDQAAREALAETVELAQAAAAAFAPPPPAALPATYGVAPRSRRPHSWQRYRWMAMGAAASVLSIFAWQHYGTWEPSVARDNAQDAHSAAAEAASRALAARWSEVRERENPLEAFPDFDPSGDPWSLDGDLAASSDDVADSDFGASAAPEWMLAAAAQRKGSSTAANGMFMDEMEHRTDPPQEQ